MAGPSTQTIRQTGPGGYEKLKLLSDRPAVGSRLREFAFCCDGLKNLLFCTPGGSPWGIAEGSLIRSQPVTHLCQIPASSIAFAAANAGQPSLRFGMMRGFARHGVDSAIAGGAGVLQQQRTQRLRSFATSNKK